MLFMASVDLLILNWFVEIPLSAIDLICIWSYLPK